MRAATHPPAGCPFFAPPGTHGLWYVSPDGNYWCLNDQAYRHDVITAPIAALGHALLDLLLLLLYGSSIALLLGALVLTAYAQLNGRLDLSGVIVQSWGVPDDD